MRTGALVMAHERWIMASGLWSWPMYSGLLVLAHGLWPTGYGLWVMAYWLWPMGYGLWVMAYGCWPMPMALVAIWKFSRTHLALVG